MSFENESHTSLKLNDVFVDSGSLDLSGPGTFRIQACSFNNRGETSSPLIINHSGADVLVVGGNMKSGKAHKPHFMNDDIYNIWQKRGRLRVYGTGVQHSLGRADFRIDSGSELGEHVISFVRSEGTNDYITQDWASTLLYVPESADKVNVVLSANAGQWPKNTRHINRLIDYNAAGRVWLIGNSSHLHSDTIIHGDYENAVIYAISNRTHSRPQELSSSVTIRSLVNVYSHAESTGDRQYPRARYVTTYSRESMPIHYEHYGSEIVPSALSRPQINSSLPGMIDVKRDFGAKGDGENDDTAPIQRALVSGKQVFIPEGKYLISDTLGYNHQKHGNKMHREGGWIAGEGMSKTSIIMKPGLNKSVFATEGMGYFVIQGISFLNDAYDSKKRLPSVPTVSLEYNEKAKGAFATQEISFYDCSFSGGKYAVAVGLDTTKMGSENMFVNSKFENANYGLAIGSYNALNNIVYNSTFSNNAISVGHDSSKRSGGTAGLINVDISKSMQSDLSLVNTAGAPWYLNNVTSKSVKLYSSPQSSMPFHLVIENSKFNSTDKDVTWLETDSGGFIAFIDTDADIGPVKTGSKMSVFPIISIHSRVNYLRKENLSVRTEVVELPRK
jgi:hypothetical protein